MAERSSRRLAEWRTPSGRGCRGTEEQTVLRAFGVCLAGLLPVPWRGGGHPEEGLQSKRWDTSRIDIVSDIANIPAPDASFDAILCSEVLEHVPEPTHALDEFARLLKPGGRLILTAPFASNVHMAPFHYCSGFSKYWYKHHLGVRGFAIETLAANGDWYALLRQEITRLGGLERQRGNWAWPLAYAYGMFGLAYFSLRANRRAEDLACFGWQCMAVKE